MKAKMEAEVAALEEERKRRTKARLRKKEIQERAMANDQTVDLTQAKIDKIREHR